MIGSVHRKGNESVIIFNVIDAVLYVEEEYLTDDLSDETVSNENEIGKRKPKKVMAYPADWARSFGESYYSSCAIQGALEPVSDHWGVSETGTVFKEAEKNVTSHKEAAANIQRILTEIGVKDD